MLAGLAGAAAALPDGLPAIGGAAGAAAVAPTLARHLRAHVMRWFDATQQMLGRAGELAGQDAGDVVEAIAGSDLGVQMLELSAGAVRPPAIVEAVEVSARILARATTAEHDLDEDLLILQALADLRPPHVALLRQLDREPFFPTVGRVYFVDGGSAALDEGFPVPRPEPAHAPQAERLADALGFDAGVIPPLLGVLARHGLALGQTGPTFETASKTFYMLTPHGERVLSRINEAEV